MLLKQLFTGKKGLFPTLAFFTFFSLFLFSQQNMLVADASLAIEPIISFQEGTASCIPLDSSGTYKCIPAQGTTQITFQAPVNKIKDTYPFSGLAVFYSRVEPLKMEQTGSVEYLDDTFSISRIESKDHWVGWRGRYNIFMVFSENSEISGKGQAMTLRWKDHAPQPFFFYLGLPKDVRIQDREVQFESIQYSYLWDWLRKLCLFIHWLLVTFYSIFGNSWGWAIILLAVTMKIALLPVNILTKRSQKKVSKLQTILKPKLKEIKEKYDGEEAHNKIMAEYKSLGITPFFTLKPMMGALIQVPFLVAIFNVLADMPALQEAQFLWIDSLAYPDKVYTLPFDIPLLGNTINLMPIIMTALTIFSSIIYHDPYALPSQIKKNKRNLYLMAFAFFFLFYPFPSGMVFYWTLMNLLNLVSQQLMK